MEVILRSFPTGPNTAQLVLVLRPESENESEKLDMIGNCGAADVRVEGVIKLSDDLSHYIELKASPPAVLDTSGAEPALRCAKCDSGAVLGEPIPHAPDCHSQVRAYEESLNRIAASGVIVHRETAPVMPLEPTQTMIDVLANTKNPAVAYRTLRSLVSAGRIAVDGEPLTCAFPRCLCTAPSGCQLPKPDTRHVQRKEP